MDIKIIYSTVLFLVTAVSGIFLHRAGHPLNTVLFTIHKLAAIAMAVFLTLAMLKLYKTIELRKTIDLAMLYICGILLLATIISGGLLSIEKTSSQLALSVHNISSILFLLATSFSVYFLSR